MHARSLGGVSARVGSLFVALVSVGARAVGWRVAAERVGWIGLDWIDL